MILNETCRTRFSLGQVLVTPRILEGLKDRGQTASGMRQPLLTFFPGSKSVSTLDTAGTGMRSNAPFIVDPGLASVLTHARTHNSWGEWEGSPSSRFRRRVSPRNLLPLSTSSEALTRLKTRPIADHKVERRNPPSLGLGRVTQVFG